jgi:hypothetical protein
METCVGVVTHYYNHLGVAVLSLTADLKVNDVVRLLGSSTDFCQEVRSLEVEHHKLEMGRAGQEVALKMVATVRKGDKIYLAPEATPTDPSEIIYQRIDAWER